MAKGYDNHLKWNEQARFKADLMNVRDRWRGVAPEAFATKLRREGMREEDILTLVERLKTAQAGRRLIPQRTYRDHIFSPPPEVPSSGREQDSRVW